MNLLLFSILIVLIVGLGIILKKLTDIKNIRELSSYDIKHMKEIIQYLGRINDYESNKDK